MIVVGQCNPTEKVFLFNKKLITVFVLVDSVLAGAGSH